ncbi:MAG: hypothetical protein ISS36_02020 [Candidatus Aenigmarchaeota archaeon]|nr:hypothetical protein [Candidatus Aenigmarchaeota archaeon]
MKKENNMGDLVNFFNLISKGILCGLGAGGEYKKRPIAVKALLHPEKGYKHLMGELIESLKEEDIADGDIVIFPAKIFAIAQKRLLPSEFLEKYGKPSRLLNKELDILIGDVKKEFNIEVDRLDIHASDKTYVKEGYSSLLPKNPNKISGDISKLILNKFKKNIDVVITDTLNVNAVTHSLLSGFPSLIAIPIGATNGLVPHDLIRTSIAAEITRNKERNTPIVILKAEEGFARDGPNIGKFRYNGRIDMKKEDVPGFLRNVWKDIQ